jgi:hypothetical protein
LIFGFKKTSNFNSFDMLLSKKKNKSTKKEKKNIILIHFQLENTFEEHPALHHQTYTPPAIPWLHFPK